MALMLGVNSYVTRAEAEMYFSDRLDVAAWTSATDDMKDDSLVTSTMYLEQFNFAGYATSATQNLAWPRVGCFNDTSRGRQINFDNSYTFTEVDVTSNAAYLTAFAALPREIQLLKKATFEQAHHLLANDGVLDTRTTTTSSSSDRIRVGSIEIAGSVASGSAGSVAARAVVTLSFLRPLLQGGGSTQWFRAN